MRLYINLNMHTRKRQVRNAQLRPHRLMIRTPLLNVRHQIIILGGDVCAISHDAEDLRPSFPACLL